MSARRKKLAGLLVDAALELFRRRLWQRFASEDAIGLRIPEVDPMLVASMMGSAGREFGLTVYDGPSAFQDLIDILEGDLADVEVLERAPFVSFSSSPLWQIPPEARGVLDDSGRPFRREDRAPFFLVKRPHQNPRPPRPREVECLLYSTLAILDADERGLLVPVPLDEPGDLPVLHVEGKPQKPEVRVVMEARPAESDGLLRLDAASQSFEEVLAVSFEHLPRTEHRWLIGHPVLPARVEGEEGTVRAVLILETTTGLCAAMRALVGDSVVEACHFVADVLLRGDHQAQCEGLPGEVVFTSRELFQRLEPSLSLAGCECSLDPAAPEQAEFLGQLGEAMASGEFGAAGAPGGPEATDSGDDELKVLKLADNSVFQRMMKEWEVDGFDDLRALERYFGDAERGLDVLYREVGHEATLACASWWYHDHRSNARAKTRAEKQLQRELPELERTLLQSRLAAVPSIYRVVDTDPEGLVHVEDVITGRRLSIRDGQMARTATVDHCILARAFPAGDHHFVDIAGPPLPPMLNAQAMEVLTKAGLELSAEGLKAKPHLLGRLWLWWEEQDFTPPRMTNTDGDDLVWLTASFSVGDDVALEAALRERADLDFDEGQRRFVWLNDEDTLLGSIELLPGALVLEVNSRPRLERARAWLEKIPSVRLQGVQEKDVLEHDTPLDDRLDRPGIPDELPPELLGHLERMLHEKMMAWIDEAVPALGGKTPREACETESGRRKVAEMIRSMPRPAPQAMHIDVPRKKMLRELGLEERGRGAGGG